MAMSFTFLFVGCEKSTYTDNQAYVVQDWIEVRAWYTSSGYTIDKSEVGLYVGNVIEISVEEYTEIRNNSQEWDGSTPSFGVKKQETIDYANEIVGKFRLSYNDEKYYKSEVKGYKTRMVNIKLYSNDYMEIKVVESYYGNIETAGTSEVVSHQGRNLGSGYIEYFI